MHAGIPAPPLNHPVAPLETYLATTSNPEPWPPLLRHAQPLRRRGLTTPPRHSPGKTPSKLRLSTRELPEATIPELYPRNAGIVPDFKSGENGPPSNFLATSGPRPSLTPCSASQRNHSMTRAAQDPGGASTARTASSAPSPPPDLVVDLRAPHLRPLQALVSTAGIPPILLL